MRYIKGMVIKNADINAEAIGPGMCRKILASAGKLMSMEVAFQKGAVGGGSSHAHPHEQIGYVVSGRFEVMIGEEQAILAAGDTYYVPPNIVHGVVALEDGVVFDIFTPQRQEYLK